MCVKVFFLHVRTYVESRECFGNCGTASKQVKNDEKEKLVAVAAQPKLSMLRKGKKITIKSMKNKNHHFKNY